MAQVPIVLASSRSGGSLRVKQGKTVSRLQWSRSAGWKPVSSKLDQAGTAYSRQAQAGKRQTLSGTSGI